MKLTAKRIFTLYKSDPKAFLEFVPEFIEENHTHFSAQDVTRIALGAAMSVVDRVSDPMRVRALLSIIRDWTQGKASNKNIEEVEKELWDMYYGLGQPSGCFETFVLFHSHHAAACAAVRAARFPLNRSRTLGIAWAIHDARVAETHPQKIVNSIEKETGPLDWFLASRSM